MKKCIYIIILFTFFSCKNELENSPIKLFSNKEDLLEINCSFDEDSLARIEAIQCNNSSLVVFDYHSGKSFSLFDLQLENYIGRFGEIGQGPNEIPLGCYGYLNDVDFTINDDQTGLISKYAIDSLRANIQFRPLRLAKYKIAEAQFSRVIPINDSLFLGAGTYQSKFQFTLFDKKSEVIDFGVEIFDANNKDFNIYHKYLANQGIFQKHPIQNKFVYAINYSSNIDFVKVVNNKIITIKSIRLRDPKVEPKQNGGMNNILPDVDNSIGYIDISTSNNYVYALYSDKKLDNPFCSNIVLMFDWEGNPVKVLYLDHDAYYITVNEKLKRMYTAIKNENKGWSITSYKLNNF